MTQDGTPYHPTSTHPDLASEQPSWRTLLVRIFLIVVPTLLVGVLLQGAILTAISTQAVFTLIGALPGVLGGLVLGRLLTPARRQLGPCLAWAAVLTVGVLLTLLTIGRAQVVGPDPDPGPVVLGLLAPVGSLLVIAGALWWRKGSRSP